MYIFAAQAFTYQYGGEPIALIHSYPPLLVYIIHLIRTNLRYHSRAVAAWCRLHRELPTTLVNATEGCNGKKRHTSIEDRWRFHLPATACLPTDPYRPGIVANQATTGRAMNIRRRELPAMEVRAISCERGSPRARRAARALRQQALRIPAGSQALRRCAEHRPTCYRTPGRRVRPWT